MSVFLVATDGSEIGTAAVRETANLAATHDAELVVLTVIPRDIAPRSMSEEIREYARIEHLSGGEPEARSLIADEILAEAKAIVAERKDLKASFTSRAGDPAEEILACARERSADLLVLGSGGRGPFGAFLHGSVSHRVAGSAPCPVRIMATTE
jgi:nucleotide-binding universal stress UspA family protein